MYNLDALLAQSVVGIKDATCSMNTRLPFNPYGFRRQSHARTHAWVWTPTHATDGPVLCVSIGLIEPSVTLQVREVAVGMLFFFSFMGRYGFMGSENFETGDTWNNSSLLFYGVSQVSDSGVAML